MFTRSLCPNVPFSKKTRLASCCLQALADWRCVSAARYDLYHATGKPFSVRRLVDKIRYSRSTACCCRFIQHRTKPDKTWPGAGGENIFFARPVRACHVHNTSYMHLCVPPAAVIQRMRLKPLHNPTLCVCPHIPWQTGYFSDVYRVLGTSEARVLLYAESRRVSHSLETV